jgi:hypothetical protein
MMRRPNGALPQPQQVLTVVGAREAHVQVHDVKSRAAR